MNFFSSDRASAVLAWVVGLTVGTASVLQAKTKVQVQSVQPPQHLEVCFSPDEPCAAKVIRFVQSAQESLDIAIFDITLNELVNEIIAKSQSKIPVRVIVDRRQAKGTHSLASKLSQAGIQVRIGSQKGVMHNKFIIMDHKMVQTGSFNYTLNASQNNSENQIYLTDPLVVGRYIKRFEQLWEKAKPFKIILEKNSQKKSKPPSSRKKKIRHSRH